MSEFVALNPIRRPTPANQVPLMIQYHTGAYASGGDTAPLLTLSAELIAFIIHEVVFDSTGTPTLPRLNYLLSLKSICKAIAAADIIFTTTIFDATAIVRNSVIPRANPSTQRFLIESITGGVHIPLKDNGDGNVSSISLLVFKDSARNSPRESHWDDHLGKINLCLVTPLPDDDGKFVAMELDVEMAMSFFSGRNRENSLLFENHISHGARLLPDVFYHDEVDYAHTFSGVVKADRITVDVMFENRLGAPVVRIVTSSGGEPLLSNQDLIVPYDELSRTFGRFDPDEIGYCKFTNKYNELTSVIPCEEVRLVREAAAATARRGEAVRSDVATNKHVIKGGERTRIRPWEPGYDERRAAAEALGQRDASLLYSSDSDTSSEDEADHEEYRPVKKKAKKSNKAPVAPVAPAPAPAPAPAAAAAGSSSGAVIDLCDSDDDDAWVAATLAATHHKAKARK